MKVYPLPSAAPHPGDCGVTLLPGLLTGLLVCRQLLQVGLDQVVQPETLAVLLVLYHEVGETLHVTRGSGEVNGQVR